jgi:hypothetical protein
MSKILELYGTTGPKTGAANIKGGDKTPINADGGRDLSKDETRLAKARKGAVNTSKKYSDMAKK